MRCFGRAISVMISPTPCVGRVSMLKQTPLKTVTKTV